MVSIVVTELNPFGNYEDIPSDTSSQTDVEIIDNYHTNAPTMHHTWMISNNLLYDGGGRLPAIYPLNSSGQRDFPLILLNPCYDEENQDYYSRFRNRVDNVILHTTVASPIPRLLRDNFLFPQTEMRPIRDNLPFSSEQRNQSLDCTADKVEGLLLPTRVSAPPTFIYSAEALPSLMIRQDSWVHLKYQQNGALKTSQGMRVRSTKGFVQDYKFEVLELEPTFFDPKDHMNTVLFLVPPPFIHGDVPISVEVDSFMRTSFDVENAVWMEKEFGEEVVVLTKDQHDERNFQVLKLLQRSTMAFRRQRP